MSILVQFILVLNTPLGKVQCRTHDCQMLIAVQLYLPYSVCYIAGELVKKLKQDNPLLISDRDVLCVQIAALCHDLGMYELDALYLHGLMYLSILITKNMMVSGHLFILYPHCYCSLLSPFLSCISIKSQYSNTGKFKGTNQQNLQSLS